MKKLVWLLLLTVVLSACGTSTTTTSSTGPSMASVASKVSAVKAATAVPTAEQQTTVLQLVQAMFNASPGATYLNEFAGYVAGGMSPATLANLFASTDLFKVPSLYPDSLNNQQFAERFINNLVGSTVSDANRSWAIGWVAGMLNSGTTRGEVIWTAVSALASVPTSNPDWGAAVIQLNNKVSASYYYAVTKAVSSTDLATLQAVTASVSNDPASVTAAKAGIDSANPSYSIEGNYTGVMTITSTACTTNFTVGQTMSRPTVITKQSGNTYALSGGAGMWGVSTDASPLYATLTGNRLVGTFTQPPIGAGYSCPTCAWTIGIDATLDASGNVMSGSIVKTATGGECSYSGTFTGTKQSSSSNVFTTAMLSGKTFNVSTNCGNGIQTTTTATFNADGTLVFSAFPATTWNINSSGQLLTSNSTKTDTVTLTSVTATGFTSNEVWKITSTGDTGTCTQTATLM